MRESMERFAGFCEEHGVDPTRWVMARHAAVGWRHRIPVEQLASEAFLPSYHEWAEDRQASVQEQERLADKVIPNHTTPGALVLGAEALKAALVASPLVCLGSATLTYGWDPASRWCVKCAQAGPCRDGLNPSVRERRDARSV